MARRGCEQDADDFILHEAQTFGAASAVTILQQDRLSDLAGRDHLGLQQFRHRGPEKIFASGMLLGQRIDRGGDPRGIETIVGLGSGLCHNAIHALSRYRTAPTLSRDIAKITAGPCCIREALSNIVLIAPPC
jgi:hypothetical protein